MRNRHLEDRHSGDGTLRYSRGEEEGASEAGRRCGWDRRCWEVVGRHRHLEDRHSGDGTLLCRPGRRLWTSGGWNQWCVQPGVWWRGGGRPRLRRRRIRGCRRWLLRDEPYSMFFIGMYLDAAAIVIHSHPTATSSKSDTPIKPSTIFLH